MNPLTLILFKYADTAFEAPCVAIHFNELHLFCVFLFI